MSHTRRLSTSTHERSGSISTSPIAATIPTPAHASPEDTKAWLDRWRDILAKDIIDSRIVSVDANTSVEDACNILLSEDIPCLALKSNSEQSVTGLFDFADVNAFLTLAATRHSIPSEELHEKPRVDEIFAAARSGHVPVHLVSNLSEKNPLESLPHDATLISLLELFARGSHRVLIHSPENPAEFSGIVSDRSVLAWFASYAEKTQSLQTFLSNPLNSFSLPNLYSSVVAAMSTDSVLEAMKLMSEEGVSSVAVLDQETGTLLSAVSVTDIGKIVVPSESNHILATPLHQFVSFIKAPVGSADGEEKYPVYSVYPNSTLLYTLQKILATNAHRVFVSGSPSASPVISPGFSPNLSGIVSVVDILSLFARIANVQDVDPTRMKRHRRASSVSSTRSSRSDSLSRSNSRTGHVRRASSIKNPQPRPVVVEPSSNLESAMDGKK